MTAKGLVREQLIDMTPALRAYARSLTREAHEADDLVQETLVRAIAGLHQFRPGTNLRAWLFTIQRNAYFTRYQKQRREPVMATDELPHARVMPSQEWSLKLRLVDQAVGRLPVDQREALMLVGGAGMSYEEAAEICGCAVGTIKSRVSRARSRLLELLDVTSERDFLNEQAS